MSKLNNLKASILFVLLSFFSISLAAQSKGNDSKSLAAQSKGNDGKVILAYVTSWSSVMPNPQMVTHINYAFGHVDSTFTGVKVDNPQRLRQIARLKKKNPHLKVMLSGGGWGSGRFSEMAADQAKREKFAKDCRGWLGNSIWMVLT